MKKLIERMTKALKDAGVELNDGIRSAVADVLGADELKAAGLTEIGSGQKVVEESDFNELHADLRKMRTRAQNAETARDTLQKRLDSVDSDSKKRADEAQAELDKIKPVAELALKWARDDWSRKSSLIPVEKEGMKDSEKARVAQLRKQFVFPDEGKQLSDDQIFANLSKHAEYSAIGLFGDVPALPAKETKPTTTTPRLKPNGAGDEKPVTREEAWNSFYEATDPHRPQPNDR